MKKSNTTIMVIPHVLVHLHLYYQDQWPYFQKKLSAISGCKWDLYITLTCPNPVLEEKIHRFKPTAVIYKVANIGYDIWPFIQVLKLIDLSQYDYVLKLHTKQPKTFIEENINPLPWRESLVEPLLGSAVKFQYALQRMQQGANLCCAGKCVLQRQVLLPEDTYIYQQLLNHLHLTSSTRWFVAGTMFLIRAACLAPLKNSTFTEKSFDSTSHSNASGSLAHAIERIFIELAQVKKGSITLLDYPRQFNTFQYLKKCILLGRYKLMYRITKGKRKTCYKIKTNTLRKKLKGTL